MRRIALGIVRAGSEASPDVTPTISTPMNEYRTRQQPSQIPEPPNGANPPLPRRLVRPIAGSPVAPTTSSTPSPTNSTTARTLIITSQYSTAPSQPTRSEFSTSSTAAKPNTHAAAGTSGNQNPM